MIQVVILGAGNVASQVYKAFKKSKLVDVVALYNRNLASFDTIPYIDDNVPVIDTTAALPFDADVYIIAVTDDAISDLSEQLMFRDRLVVHTSGGVALTALHKRNRRGVWYPLQTFSKGSTFSPRTLPICIEAEARKDIETLDDLAKAISDNVHVMTSTQRRALHLAGVFVNNFVNHLYHMGHEICDQHQLPFTLLQPLITETVNKIKTMPPYHAQTGPARRNDKKTIKKHLDMLENKTYRKIYQEITNAILKTYGKEL